MNYGDAELLEPFLKVDSDSGKVSTSMDIDREKYDVSNYFEVLNKDMFCIQFILNSLGIFFILSKGLRHGSCKKLLLSECNSD